MPAIYDDLFRRIPDKVLASNGMIAKPSIVLPDKTFSTISKSWPIPAVIGISEAESEQPYQERIIPKLLKEVQNEGFVQEVE